MAWADNTKSPVRLTVTTPDSVDHEVQYQYDQYTTSEIDTGQIWNGKRVYRKSIGGASLSVGVTTILASGATEIVRCYGFVTNTGNSREVVVQFTDGTNNVYAYRDTGTNAIAVFVQTGSAFIGNNYKITAEYIK